MTTSRPSSTTSSPDAPAAAVRHGAPVRGVLDGIVASVRVAGFSVLRGRRGVALGLVCLLPLIAPALVFFQNAVAARGGAGFAAVVSDWCFKRVNLFVALFLGCAALGEEIEGKTIPYLLTRPVPRSALLIGRWLTAVVASTALLGASYVVLYFATVGQLGGEALLVDLPLLGFALIGLVLSLLAYNAVFMALSVVTKWPLVIGLALLFIWEEWALDLPGRLANWTVLHHVYVLLARLSGNEEFVRRACPDDSPLLATSDSVQVLLGITIACLAISIAKFRKKPYLV